MGTAHAAVNLAASQLGTAEGPGGGTKYHAWYGAPGSWAWCAIFVSWVLHHSGTPNGPGAHGGAWCTGIAEWYRSPSTPGHRIDMADAAPGDLVYFEWGTTPGGYDHIGMVERVEPGYVFTIEGNTSNRVMRHRRARAGGGILELSRPAYTDTPTAPDQEDDDVQARDLLIRDGRNGRKGATYLTTVFDNVVAGKVTATVGSHQGVLLPNAAMVDELRRAGVQMLEVAEGGNTRLLDTLHAGVCCTELPV